jgi:steroid delta-isomerase-like uncharacterized protein
MEFAMSAQNKTLVRRWFDQVWNKGRAEAIDDLLSDRSVVHGLGDDLIGPSGFKPFHAAYRNAFPDLTLQIDRMVAEDDLVAVHWSASATHSGGGLGFAASGKAVKFTGMAFIRLEGNKLVEGWNSFDQLGLLQQIGVVTLPAS